MLYLLLLLLLLLIIIVDCTDLLSHPRLLAIHIFLTTLAFSEGLKNNTINCFLITGAGFQQSRIKRECDFYASMSQLTC